MKIKVLLYLALALILQSCWYCPGCNDDGDVIDFVSAYEPILLDRTEFENSLQSLPATGVINSGKIYVFNQLLFINEKNKGFHVYNNEDPRKPVPIAYLEIPGATDLAIRNGVYYVNQATDLIAITFTANNEMALNVSKRIPNIFPELRSPDGFYATDKPENSIVIGWLLKTEDL